MNSIADLIGKLGAGGDGESTGPALNEESAFQDEGGPMDVEAMRNQLDAIDHPDSLRALGHAILDAHEQHVHKSSRGAGEPQEHRGLQPAHRKSSRPEHHRSTPAPKSKPARSAGHGDGRRYDTSTNTYR